MSLETALTLPVLALALLALLQTAGVLRDALLVQEAAHAGARVAVTTHDDGAVRDAVAAAMGGRPVHVTVAPSRRRAGTQVTVTVRHTARLGPVSVDLHGRAAARGEPVLSGAP